MSAKYYRNARTSQSGIGYQTQLECNLLFFRANPYVPTATLHALSELLPVSWRINAPHWIAAVSLQFRLSEILIVIISSTLNYSFAEICTLHA